MGEGAWNAGEHQKVLRDICAKEGILIEYTARATPQQNGQVERAIATDRGRRNAMMHGSGLSAKEKGNLRAEATQMANRLAHLLVSDNQAKPADELLPTSSGQLRPENLRLFGQKGYVYTKKKIQGKNKPRATIMFMVGYAADHSPDTYRMFNPATRKVILTRDVKWTQAHLQDQKSTDDPEKNRLPTTPTTPIEPEWPEPAPIATGPHLIPPDDDDDDDIEFLNPPRTQNSTQREATVPPSSGRMNRNRTPREVTRLQSAWNYQEAVEAGRTGRTRSGRIEPTPEVETQNIFNQPTRIEREAAIGHQTTETYDGEERERQRVSEEESSDDETVVALTDYVFLTTGEPRNVNEALRGPEATKWMESMRNEVENFINRGAWKKCDLREIVDQGYKPIGTKTVFKIKNEHDGSQKYKTRIVSLGYNMRPGEHFNNSFSLVATDISIRMVLGIGLAVMNEERSKNWKRVTRKKREKRKEELATERKVRFTEKVGQQGRKNLPLCFGCKRDNPNEWTIEMFDVQAAFLNADRSQDFYSSPRSDDSTGND